MRKTNTMPGVLPVAAVALALAASAVAAEPQFQNLRYKDSQESREQGPVYLKLGLNDASDLSLGGQARVRGEWWDNFGFAPDNDDEFLLTRLRLHGDLRVCRGLRLFVEGRSALVNGRDLPTPDGSGKRPIDEDVLDLQNAFGDVSVGIDEKAGLTLRAGRQEMAFGKERVIGVVDWSNTRRTFDGVRGTIQSGGWTVDAFAVRPITLQRYAFNDGYSGQDFYGVYMTGKDAGRGVALDLYALERFKHQADPAKADEKRDTLGAHLSGACGASGFDYDVEGAYQLGEAGNADIGAWSIAAQLGYAVPDCPFGTRFFLEYDYASGDDDPAGGDLKRYDQLYPTGHAFFGLVDAIGRQNIRDYCAGVSGRPAKKITAKIEGHWFERAETADAVFDAGGNPVVPGGASDAREIGQELDVTVGWKLNAHLLLTAGYGRFFAGDVVNDASGEDIDTAYVSGEYTF